MNRTFQHNFVFAAPRWTAALLLALSASLLAGCKGNTSSAALPEQRIEKPPIVHAQRAAGDMHDADPLASPLWQSAAWSNFVPPINATATTPPTRAAVMYDSDNLYIAFICQKSQAASGEMTDSVSLFVDTKNEGKELLQVAADSAGGGGGGGVDGTAGITHNTWFRNTSPAVPREDGSPDLSFPVDRYPDVKGVQAWCMVRESTDTATGTWSAVIGIPLKTLPGPMRATPEPGHPWKFNLVRVINITSGGKRIQQLQSNLSPVFVDSQPVSPYRLAELDFAK